MGETYTNNEIARLPYTYWEEWFLDGYTYTRCKRGGIFHKFLLKRSIVVRAELAGRGILSPKREKDELFDRQICLLYSVSSFGAIVCRSPVYPFGRRRSSFTICIQPATPTWPPSAFISRVKALRAKCTPPNVQQPHLTVIRCFILRPHHLILKTTYLSNTFIHRASPFRSACIDYRRSCVWWATSPPSSSLP